MKTNLLRASWACFAIGILGIVVGVSGDHVFPLPGAVLTGLSLIALSIQQK